MNVNIRNVIFVFLFIIFCLKLIYVGFIFFKTRPVTHAYNQSMKLSNQAETVLQKVFVAIREGDTNDSQQNFEQFVDQSIDEGKSFFEQASALYSKAKELEEELYLQASYVRKFFLKIFLYNKRNKVFDSITNKQKKVLRDIIDAMGKNKTSEREVSDAKNSRVDAIDKKVDATEVEKVQEKN